MTEKSLKLRSGLSIRKLPQSNNYSVYIKFDGYKKLQYSLKTNDKQKAIEKAWEEYMLNKLLLERGEPIRQPKQRLSLHQIIEQLICEHGNSQAKVKIEGRDGKYATQIRLFKKIKDFYPNNLQPHSLDLPQVRSYFEEYQPFSNTQLIATRYCFTEIFDRSLEKKLISRDQTFDLKKIKVEKMNQTRRDHFTYYEFSKVANYGLRQIKSAHGKGKHTQHMAVVYISFLFHSGVRAGYEALGITWSDLSYTSFGDLYATIKDGKTKKYQKNNRNVIFDAMAESCIYQAAKIKHAEVAKNKQPKEVIDYLIKHKPNDSVFATNYSQTPTYPKIFKKWVEKMKDDGVLSKSKDLTLYSLRHSYITRSIEAEAPLPLIAENAGTSVSMIEKHYSHITVMTNEARQALLRDKVAMEVMPVEDPIRNQEKLKKLVDLAKNAFD